MGSTCSSAQPDAIDPDAASRAEEEALRAEEAANAEAARAEAKRKASEAKEKAEKARKAKQSKHLRSWWRAKADADAAQQVKHCKFERIRQATGSFPDKVAGRFDKRGVLYRIATKAGAQDYVNPHEGGEVVAAMSTAYVGDGVNSSPHMLVAHDHPGGDDSNQNSTEARPVSWFSIDLGPSRSLRIDHYALRHGYSGVGLRLRSWQLQGSKDGTRWTTLDQHKDDDSLPAKGWCVAHWAVKGVKEEYQHFRIKQTGKNSGGGNVLSCAGIELYGKLRQLPEAGSAQPRWLP